MEGMVGKGSLKAVCSIFYIISFFLMSPKSGVLNLLPSDNVIQFPYHPYTVPFKIKSENKERGTNTLTARDGKEEASAL